MSTKDDRPNLLSKVALFVKNPTKDWSELDNPDTLMQSGYDRSALKAAIERKRQNDFVRRREFDQLRKLRKSQANGEVAQVRPSMFQSSSVTDPDARALTLKKIDEIEAQMSKQWWKGKAEGAADAPAAPQAGAVESQVGVPSTTQSPPTQFPATQPAVPAAGADEFAATQVASGMVATVVGTGLARQDPAGPDMGAGFSTSQLFATEAQDMTTDPELEEAAIRFANSDDGGAESVLLEALRSQPGETEVALSWLTALLDLYRATGNRPGFDQAVLEFSWRFPSMRPAWADYREPAEPGMSGADPVGALSPGSPLWHCPSLLDQSAMEHLRAVLSSSPMPWRLDWSAIQTVAADAQALLGALFGSLCTEPVAVEFSGVEALVGVLRGLTPTSDRSVPHELWVLRLDALRVMQRMDDFELAALDYCVTFEVAPPPWMPAACQFAAVEVADDGAATTVTAPMHTVPVRFDAATDTAVPDGALAGVLSGDASEALGALLSAIEGKPVAVVSCASLVRVDFAAAGSILNWVATQQSAGRTIQLVQVHRLVAAFFNVIGINEHARVIPRGV
ncbi:STAS domain-containing protein [Curvibacter sp. APW13]|uniref:type IV pilus assembly protein FimV n=1 Tax=Curvibacter sp. APW13 TaxID=3077236 RepID=UPI0028DED9B7|nr:STAS domain-containing protein [Curvibacter sp. APW13]MDT8989809.1 STAS domain-containing protein [Curvibacter sp. APW13]